MTSLWDDPKFSKEIETGTGGDWPDIPDDLYDAEVSNASEPEDVPDTFNQGQMRTQFYLTWLLMSDEVPEGTTLRQYLTLPQQYLEGNFLSGKSAVWKTMDALGYDMNARYVVNPQQWVGKRARVMVENKANQKGDIRPRIVDVKPRRARQQSTKQQPVGVGRTFRERAMEENED